MTPADREARRRFTLLSATRAIGAAAMLIGLWAWQGHVIRSGGWPELGIPLFLGGMVASFIVPIVLVRRWRTPRP
jgi:hypothetical protein